MCYIFSIIKEWPIKALLVKQGRKTTGRKKKFDSRVAETLSEAKCVRQAGFSFKEAGHLKSSLKIRNLVDKGKPRENGGPLKTPRDRLKLINFRLGQSHGSLKPIYRYRILFFW